MKNIFLTLRSRCTNELDTKYEKLHRSAVKIKWQEVCHVVDLCHRLMGQEELASYKQYRVETAPLPVILPLPAHNLESADGFQLELHKAKSNFSLNALPTKCQADKHRQRSSLLVSVCACLCMCTCIKSVCTLDQPIWISFYFLSYIADHV